MLESIPARRLASFLAVLIAVLLAWPLQPRAVAAESEQPALQRADTGGEALGLSEQRPIESNEQREVDDSENEKSNVDLACTFDWALGCELGGHRITTLARQNHHVSPGHARLERERGPPMNA